MASEPGHAARGAIDAVWRIESARVIAGLARFVGDVGVAEDLAHDALAAALEQWPESGVPDNPGAWLMAVGKRRAVDLLRRRTVAERKHEELGRHLEARAETWDPDAEVDALDEAFGDDLLRLIFIACHPVLSTEGRVALTLRLLGGLTTDEIARGFLVREPTVAQRIVRAKRTLAEAKVPFEVPEGADLTSRVASVLEVLYLVFNEGYSATAGDDWMRPALCEDALRLGRVLAELLPAEPEVHGLAALMEIQASRARARIGASGEPVLLLDQDRSRWDHVLVRRGLAALERAENLGQGLGPYGLQAAIAACHARARVASETDWARIAALYDALAQLAPSPVVELNRAAALTRNSRESALLLERAADSGLSADSELSADSGISAARPESG
jgi:RNA polymerase sigma factor (sigma-70 family)